MLLKGGAQLYRNFFLKLHFSSVVYSMAVQTSELYYRAPQQETGSSVALAIEGRWT